MKMTSVSGLQTTKVLRGVLLSTKERLFYLLDNNTNKYDIDYSPLALSNHLSHGLVAIWGLGGSEEHLNKFYNEYTTGDLYNHYHLDPAHPIEEVPKSRKDVLENWRGKYHNFTGILRFFEEENTRLKNTYPDRCSWKQLVASYAPYLSEGVSGQAFHGVIQLGYGIEVEKEKTILEGLAYWLYSYRSLGPSKKPTKEFTTDEFGVRDVVEMVSYVRHEVLKTGKLDESITRETRFMPQTKAATEAYRSIIDDTQLGLLQLLSKNRPHDANKVYEVAERKVTDAIYKTLASSNNDFFVTHLVTALRALRKVLSVIDEISDPLEGDDADFLNVHERSSLLLKGRMLDDFWQAAIAAYITQGYPEVKEKLFTLEDWSTLPEWPAIIEKLLDGVEKKDEHDAKTVFVCHQDDLEEYFVDQSNNSKSVDEQRKDASHLLRLVAARKAGLLPWPPITAEKR